MWALWVIAALVLTVGSVGEGQAEDALSTRPLLTIARNDLSTILPPDSHILIDPRSIEQFLDALDGTPPDWGLVYGHGHHDPAHDERLFTLNRERDAKRAARSALTWRLAFAWAGELSSYKPELGGFPVALGPKFIKTRWGMVRFKPEEAPSNLVAIADAVQRDRLQQQLEAGKSVEIDVVMIGKLIPEESIMYDFSHDEEGLGLIMPFVRIERVVFVMAP